MYETVIRCVMDEANPMPVCVALDMIQDECGDRAAAAVAFRKAAANWAGGNRPAPEVGRFSLMLAYCSAAVMCIRLGRVSEARKHIRQAETWAARLATSGDLARSGRTAAAFVAWTGRCRLALDAVEQAA